MWCKLERPSAGMNAQQLHRILASGEDSKHQFKHETSRIDSLAAENEFRGIMTRPGRAIEPVTPLVTDPIIRLLLMLSDGSMAPSMIQSALGLKHRPTFRANYLYPALESGLIEMTISDKPNSSQQRYQLIAAGQQLLQQQHERGQQS